MPFFPTSFALPVPCKTRLLSRGLFWETSSSRLSEHRRCPSTHKAEDIAPHPRYRNHTRAVAWPRSPRMLMGKALSTASAMLLTALLLEGT